MKALPGEPAKPRVVGLLRHASASVFAIK